MAKETIVRIGNHKINVVSTSKQKSYITANDKEMDKRAINAVKQSINRAKTCQKPIAKYDLVNKKAYLEYANGEKRYVD